jgi:hypothetical protein
VGILSFFATKSLANVECSLKILKFCYKCFVAGDASVVVIVVSLSPVLLLLAIVVDTRNKLIAGVMESMKIRNKA